MHESFSSAAGTSTKIAGRSALRSEGNFRPWLFGAVAKLIWDKPDTVIADIAGVSDRAARDYLNGKVAPPAIVVAAMLIEVCRRPHH